MGGGVGNSKGEIGEANRREKTKGKAKALCDRGPRGNFA